MIAIQIPFKPPLRTDYIQTKAEIVQIIFHAWVDKRVLMDLSSTKCVWDNISIGDMRVQVELPEEIVLNGI